MAPALRTDVAVIGAGVAGLYTALIAARGGARVVLISATPLAQTASYWAQGGLAAALSDQDSPARHLEDTERAGRNIVRRSAAAVLTREAPRVVADLQAVGVRFDADRHGNLALGLEGGHTLRRVVHAGGSATGRRVVRDLSALVVEAPRIAVLEGARAAALCTHEGRVTGVALEDGRTFAARATVLSTGGAAALWSRTTNPPGSLGTGLQLAHAVGAALADLEMVQFHPTAVIGVRHREGFLVTEAIRGEGATLHAPAASGSEALGERFVDELAPRDEVARATFDVLERTGAPSVALDMRAIDPTLFPNVVGALRESGLDPTREPVPVAPAAHYVMGGIVTDLDARSTVPGLLAVGEAACTGLHGANRLASNSLSECVVFAARAARAALDEPAGAGATSGRPADGPALHPVAQATREALWRHAGLARDRAGLELLGEDPHPLARLVAACGLARRESRGAHRREDFPRTDPALDCHHAVVEGSDTPNLEHWE
ncbi:MAG TPA: FAD-dependent oxidoreductase [Solirubrobacteraceae bacterium]|nr:FAD-dependent oxidoreductase [Solirubrobacteraceae bacterium]